MMNMKRLFLELQYAVVNLSQQNMDVKQSCVIHNNIFQKRFSSLSVAWLPGHTVNIYSWSSDRGATTC